MLQGSQELESGTIIPVGGARIGVLRGDRGLVPEEVRVLMLRGASVVIWSTGDVEVPEMVARTRADENRIFLVVMAGDGTWTVYGPTGAPISSGPGSGMTATLVEPAPRACLAQGDGAGHGFVRGRIPSLFGPLAGAPLETRP